MNYTHHKICGTVRLRGPLHFSQSGQKHLSANIFLRSLTFSCESWSQTWNLRSFSSQPKEVGIFSAIGMKLQSEVRRGLPGRHQWSLWSRTKLSSWLELILSTYLIFFLLCIHYSIQIIIGFLCNTLEFSSHISYVISWFWGQFWDTHKSHYILVRFYSLPKECLPPSWICTLIRVCFRRTYVWLLKEFQKRYQKWIWSVTALLPKYVISQCPEGNSALWICKSALWPEPLCFTFHVPLNQWIEGKIQKEK